MIPFNLLSLIGLDGSQVWMRFKWELWGNRGSKLSAIVAFLSFTPLASHLKSCIVKICVFFVYCDSYNACANRFCVLKCWIINASLTASPNPSQTTIPPFSSSAYWQPGEMRCPAVLFSTVQALAGTAWGQARWGGEWALCLGLEWPSVLTALTVSLSDSQSTKLKWFNNRKRQNK